MTSVTFDKTADGLITGFTVDGHASFADKGKDIVCAAISMMTINTVNSIDMLTEDGGLMDVDSDDERGFIRAVFTEHPGEKASLLLRSFELGCTALVKQYGKDFIEVKNNETGL